MRRRGWAQQIGPFEAVLQALPFVGRTAAVGVPLVLVYVALLKRDRISGAGIGPTGCFQFLDPFIVQRDRGLYACPACRIGQAQFFHAQGRESVEVACSQKFGIGDRVIA